jgi:hypothetical protein
MPSSLLVRCEQCGHESAARYHFCGMCGAKLPPPQPPAPLPPISQEPHASEPVGQVSEPILPIGSEHAKRISSEAVRPVSGPSFLGLADDSTSSVSYLLEDELSESHWGRSLVLLLILIGIGFAGWHWRDQLRTYVASRLAQHPNNQSDQASSGEAPGSEIGAGMPNGGTAADKPMTGVGDLPVTTAQNPGAPASQAIPPGVQNLPANSIAAAAQNSPAASGNSSNLAATANQESGNAAANTSGAAQKPTEPAGSAEQNSPTETANAKHAAPPVNSKKRGKTQVKEAAPGSSGADELEAQGEKYLYGSGAPQSCGLAQKSLQAAADRGSTKANSVLGTMYATGHCVGRDLPLAYRWFAKALQAEPNNDRLSRDLQVLWNQMSPDERQLAMRR